MYKRSLSIGFSFIVVVSLVFAVLGMGASPAQAEDVPLPVTHQLWNDVIGVSLPLESGTLGVSGFKNPKGAICTTSSSDPNVNTDCELDAPHNETSIASNPTNPQNLIGSVNDYQLVTSSGGHVFETVYSRAHVSFDGGTTWTNYPIKYNGYAATGDPSVAYDATGRAYLATLGFLWSQGNFCCTNPDIIVTHSEDSGVTWSAPVQVAKGSGAASSVGTFNDKEYLTAWGDGNAIVTWTIFPIGVHGAYLGSPIYASVTHDGGNTWSSPAQISGSAAFCTGFFGGNSCDQDQGSVPVVAADGSIYVAFVNYSDYNTGRDQYLVVKVDPATGERVGGPWQVGTVYDGFTDYPFNFQGRQTLQDSEFRTWAVGNIAADPTNASHLAVIWSDMRNSTLPAPADPYSAVTNSDVIVSQSFDGGQTWSSPQAIIMPNDQFQPWGDYTPAGLLQVGFFDRSYDPANHAYGFTLATETSSGSLTFNTQQVSTALSDPTQNTRWFSGVTINPDFPHPTSFLGDYSNIDAFSGGTASYWTDLREQSCFGGRCGSSEDAFFAATP